MAFDIEAVKPGERIWKWWDSGALGAQPSPFTVVRVNRVTVTVLNNMNEQIRVKKQEWVNYADWE